MSNLFPGGDSDMVHVTLTLGVTSEVAEERIKQAAVETLGLSEEVVADIDISYLPEALPIFHPGHSQRVKEANESLPDDVSLVGNYFGWTSITGCLALSKHVATRIKSAKL